MKTIERNFTKNPHTARFLQTFHSAAYGHATEATPELADMSDAADLLAQIPVEAPAYRPSEAQRALIVKLMHEIGQLDHAAGEAAAAFTTSIDLNNAWTRDRGHKYNPSTWIGRLIAKANELKVAKSVAPATAPEIPAGRYGIVDGEVKCYSLDYGKPGSKWAGFTFLNRISSDDRFPIRNGAEKARILAAIAADIDGAAVLAATTLRRCRKCGRQLSDTKNPYFAEGLGPDCGAM